MNRFVTGILLAASLLIGASAGAQKIVGQSRYASSGPLEVAFVAATESGDNSYVIGTSGLNSLDHTGAAVTEKFAPDGTLVWKDLYSTSANVELAPKFVAVSSGGQVFVAGRIKFASNGSTQVYLRSLNTNGSVLWSIADSFASDVVGLKLDAGGNPMLVEVAGSATSLVKYDANTSGALWTKPQNYGATNNLDFFVSDGAGHTYIMLATSTSTHHLAKVNEASGDPDWHFDFQRLDVSNLRPSDGIVTTSGDLFITGTGHNASPSYDVLTLDRVAGATGAFFFHKALSAQTSGSTATKIGPMVTDGSNNVFFGLTETISTAPFQATAIVKLAPDGSQIFTAPIPNAYTGVILSPSSTGGVYAAPSTGNAARTFRLISKTGQTVWSTSADSQFLAAGGRISVDSHSNLGYINSTSDVLGNRSFGLLKLNGATGAITYDLRQRPNGILDSSIAAVAGHDSGGNTYVVGTEDISAFAAKISPTGAVLWKTYVGPASKFFTRGQIVAATYSSTLGLALAVQTNSGFGVAELDNTGHTNWTTEFVPTQEILVRSLAVDSAGNVDMGSFSINPTSNLLLDQFSGASGLHLWSNSNPVNFSSAQISLDGQDDVYAVGIPPGLTGWLVVKVDRNGVQQFAKIIPGETFGFVSEGILCEPATGDFFLAAGDSTTVNNVAAGSIRVDRYDSSGNMRWTRAVPFPGFGSPETFDLKYSSSLNAIVVAGTIPYLGDFSRDLFAASLNSTSGVPFWSNALTESGDPQQAESFDFDAFGNVLFASTIKLDFYRNRCKLVKLDHATGAVRFSTTSQGQYTSPFVTLTGVSCGPDNEPMVFGQTPSAWGPGVLNGFMVKFGPAPYCVDRTFVGRKGITLSASVANGNEDAGGSVYKVISGPSKATSFSLSPNGSFTYLTNSAVASDKFTFRATSAFGVSNVARVTIVFAK